MAFQARDLHAIADVYLRMQYGGSGGLRLDVEKDIKTKGGYYYAKLQANRNERCFVLSVSAFAMLHYKGCKKFVQRTSSRGIARPADHGLRSSRSDNDAFALPLSSGFSWVEFAVSLMVLDGDFPDQSSPPHVKKYSASYPDRGSRSHALLSSMGKSSTSRRASYEAFLRCLRLW